MEDLIALFDDHEEGDGASIQIQPRSRPAVPTQPSKNAQIAVDERVGGIHMINRKISSSQLEDYLNESTFHTAAQLGFYSHEMLNTAVLLDSVDLTTTPLAGHTRIITVGIVLYHTGSRLTASNGQAFCKVELGTLRTGPTIAVLLFGTAYRVHARSIGMGTVIGIRQPRLLPPKPGDRITFAINDADQLLSIAQARDFGWCQGSCRGKDERGMWVANARPCRNFVDMSVSRFCKDHQTSAKKQDKKSNLDHLREQTTRMARNQQIAMASQRKENIPGRILTLPKAIPGRNADGPHRLTNNNSLLNPAVNHLSSTCQLTKAPPVPVTTKRKLTATRFDGSVRVPQPSSIFGRCHQPVQSTLCQKDSQRERKPDEILAQQKRIAQQTQTKTLRSTVVTTTTKQLQTTKPNNKAKILSPQNAFATAFGPTLDMAEEAVRNAKSSFSNEANAEEYAISCQALAELEQREAKRRRTNEPTKRLVQIWHCRTCEREYKTHPKPCYRQNHKIKVERILRQDDTISDKRQKRTTADPVDGGLVLGQGLDWSLSNRF